MKFLFVFFCTVAAQCQDKTSDCNKSNDEWNILKFFTSCVANSQVSTSCDSLSICVAENVIQFAKEANIQCLKTEPKVRCDVAPAAFVTLEKLRQLVMEVETNEKSANSDSVKLIRQLCTDPFFDSHDENTKLTAAFNKFFASAGKHMRFDVSVSKEISNAEFERNVRALFALVVSFGLPGIFSVCEPSHLKTTLLLQIVSLTAVSFYQFVRKGWIWTLLSIGACLLVLIIQFGLLYLFRSKHREEKPIVFRE